MKIKDLMNHLKQYDPELDCAYSLWIPDDVIETAQNLGVNISNEQIEEVLYIVNESHDANYGISWQTLEYAIDNVVNQK